MQIHQFHPTVSFGDATSNQILSLRRILRHAGHRGHIFCEQSPLHFEGRARQIHQYEHFSSPNNVLLLHYSLYYSPRVLAWLEQIPDRKVLIYHNITPHTYFHGINEVFSETAQVGREQLSHLRSLVEAGWGDSEFNRQELAARGWSHTAVLPIVFETRRYAVRPDRKVLKHWRDGTNVLYVGRVSPNKCFEDLILAFYYLKKFVRRDARLLLVGSARGLETYLEFLQALVKRLNLADVHFIGHVSTSELAAFYSSASVYVSMSEHEGFGVPLLESMYYGVPIIAYKIAAVPETMGGSGILVKSKDHAAIAELVGILLEDDDLRTRVVAQQRERVNAFLPALVEKRLLSLLRDLGL